MNDIKKLLKDKAKVISLGQYKEAAEICNAIGNEFEKQERYDEALEQHIEELSFCEITGDQLSIAVANRKIGESYAFLCKFKKAIEYIQKYYDIALSINSVVEQQRAHSTFGRTYYLKYQHEITSGIANSSSNTLDRALLEYLKAYKLLHELEPDIKPSELAEMKCRLLLNMGLVLENRKDYESCCDKIKVGLDIAVKYHLDEDIQRCGLALGSTYNKIGKYQDATRVFDIALTAAKKLNNKNMMCEILLCKGSNFMSIEDFDGSKKVLKTAFKLRSSNAEDHEKISKMLRVCIGVCCAKNKLNSCQNYADKKILLEKIADGLSSVASFKLAVKYYQLTLQCMEENHAVMSEKAPIYFSLAKSFLDDDNIPNALEYFEKEFNCNEDKPVEQINTLWEIAEALEKGNQTNKAEKIHLKAVSIAEKTENSKVLYDSMNKLLLFYKKVNKSDKAEAMQRKLNTIDIDCHSDEDVNEDSPQIFSDVDLSDLSDSDDGEEMPFSRRRRTKNIESKVNVKGETPLHQACISGNLSVVKRLVENGHSLNVRDYCGWTPLHEACNLGFYEIVEYLLEKGANINDSGGPQCGGITALHDAASCGNLDIMSLLIEKGASVTAVDRNGETPLHALLQWKQRSEVLDEVTLRQFKAIESELRMKMQEKGINANNIKVIPTDTSSGGRDLPSNNVREKRARSPSLSPKILSDDDNDDIDCSPPYFNRNDEDSWEDASSAKAEYKSVMENLRRSAAGISPVKKQASKTLTVPVPPLLNENEIVDDWLIKDTNTVHKVKRKKRKLTKLNVRTSKCIDNYLIPPESPPNTEADLPDLSASDSNFSITSFDSVNTAEASPSNATKKDPSYVSFCLRVQINDKLILVPVSDESKSIGWLADEVAQRFKNLDGSKPHLTLTKNGALLSGSDLIKDIFHNNEEVMSVVDSWDEPSLEERYVQLCTKRNVTPSAKKVFQSCESLGELNISNCNISSSHFSVIFSTISHFRRLVHLNISGTAISDSVMKDFVLCLSSFSLLQILNMRCCGLTSECLKRLTDYLKDTYPENVLPELKILDLSFNYFSSSSCFSVLLNLSLVSLNLSYCSVTASMFDPTFCNALKSKNCLEDLNVSGNVLGEAGISNFLKFLPRARLKKLDLKHTVREQAHIGSAIFSFLSDVFPFLTELNLQGCYLTDSDLKQISLRLVHCPKLQVCDLSGNTLLSQKIIIDFIDNTYENCQHIVDLNITGTCIWEEEYFPLLANLFNFQTLKHFCIDNCSDSFCEKIIDSWQNRWGNRAEFSNYGFLELSLI